MHGAQWPFEKHRSPDEQSDQDDLDGGSRRENGYSSPHIFGQVLSSRGEKSGGDGDAADTGDGDIPFKNPAPGARAGGVPTSGNLTLIVDRNRLQQGAGTEETNALEPLADKWRAFGWEVVELDGHDHGALIDAFDAAAAPRNKPRCIIAHTFKGHGVSFMRDQAAWHHGVPNAEQYAQAIAELEAEMAS